MKKLLTEWQKYLNESVENNEENRDLLVKAIADGLPEDQQPGFIKSETRKMMFDDDYFQSQFEAYEEEMEDYKQMQTKITRSQVEQVVREEVENLIKEKSLMPIDDYVIEEAEYQGKKVELGKVKRGGTKKFYVYVKDPKTKNVKKVSFGDTTGLSIKTKDAKRRKAFRDRHNCDNPGPKTKARYWSCRMWSGPNAIKNMLGK